MNGTNYYGVGYAGRNTTTRSSLRRDGSARTEVIGTPVTDADNLTFTSNVA